MNTATTIMEGAAAPYDRAQELREFDESKIGVKGLIESGITAIPCFFHHHDLDLAVAPTSSLSIPTVDLSLPLPEVVRLVRDACRDWGFFLAVNHGIPLDAITSALDAVRAFHELPTSVKSAYYSRQEVDGVIFNTNYDLYISKAATWRDTLQIRMGPERARAVEGSIPEACRAGILAWDGHVKEVGGRLLGIVSEGLGAPTGKLEEMSFRDGRIMNCHYYPPCPQPELTLGADCHCDPGLLIVLAQDHVGGLQVKKSSAGDDAQWVEVEPIPGALVVNVGDVLQVISNDEYRSVEHRVAANSHSEARVSIVTFFNAGNRGDSDYYEPLPEIIAQGKPARFRRFTIPEYIGGFSRSESKSRGTVDHLRI